MRVCVRAEASVGRDGGNWNLCAPWAGLQHRMAAAENSLLLLKKLDIELPYDLESTSQRRTEQRNARTRTGARTHVFTAACFIKAKRWKRRRVHPQVTG